MKILLVGEYYSENLGDPLLCQTVGKCISEAYPEAEIIPFDMSGKVGSTEYYVPRGILANLLWKCGGLYLKVYGVPPLYRVYKKDKTRHYRVWYSLNELLRKNNFDLIIFAGGSIFMDYFAGVIYLIIKALSKTKAKIIFHACGMGKLNPDSEYLVREALCSENIVSISLRDSYKEFLHLFPVNVTVSETFDTALNCSRYFKPATEKCAELGIGLIDHCYDQQLKLLKYYLNTSVNWKAFTNGSPYDQAYAERLLIDAGVLPEKIGEYLLPRPQTSEALIHTVTSFQRIIAFRLHCQIVAMSYGIPVFGIVWDRKITEFYRKMEFIQGCSEEITDCSRAEEIFRDYDNTIRLRALDQGETSCKCLLNAIDKAIKYE